MIMADLPGPKIRIGKLLEEPLLLEKGQEIMLTVKDLVRTPNQIPVDYKRLPESVKPGSLIFLNDGFIQLRVEKVSGEEVFCRTVIGGPLLSHKGLSIPGVKIIADAVSEKDLEFIAFALQEGVDAFGVSFAETAEDILKVKRFAQEKGQSAYVVAKIERAEAVERVLRDKRTTFVVVSTLEAAPVREAEFFVDELAWGALVRAGHDGLW
jgi:pyruvate kinase